MYDKSGQCFAFPHKILWSTESGKRTHTLNLLLFKQALKSKCHCVRIKFGKTKTQYKSPNSNNNDEVRTDRTITNNKPDIIIRDNEKRTCILIDVAI